MSISVNEIVDFLISLNLNPQYFGAEKLEIENFAALTDVKPNAMIWIKDLDSFPIESLDENYELLIVTNMEYKGDKKYNIITCSNSKAAYFSVLAKYFVSPIQTGIASSSTILSKKIGDNVSIGHNCFIDINVVIGSGSVIRNNVVIEGDVIIGKDCIIESGTIIGTMGFGYYNDANDVPVKVPDFGGVIIGDRVEIGANTCVARGTLANTIIGNDTKIDNLCHIAHNVVIGERCLLTAACEVSGSVTLGDDVYLGPSTSVINQIKIGDSAYTGIGTVLTKNAEPNNVMIGVPARVLRNNK